MSNRRNELGLGSEFLRVITNWRWWVFVAPVVVIEYLPWSQVQ